MSKPARRPTLADVAAASGMSKSAVSMILNARPGSRLSPEAAARVREAAEALGYRPNPAAQSLRWGKTRTIGLVSDQVTVTRFASGMIHGILRTARAHGHTVLIAETEGEPDRLAEGISSMIHQRVDGLLVGLMGARLIDLPPVPDDVPLVIVNGRTTNDDASVLPEEYEAGRGMAEILVEAGHTGIGIVGEIEGIADPRRSATISRRFAGIDDALRAAGIAPVSVTVPEWDPAIGYEATLGLLAAHPELTAIIASNDNVALGVYQAAHRLGLEIPGDLSVVSFDDEELARHLRPELTTARLPYVEMAGHATEMILGLRDLAHEVMPMPLILRQSVSAPASRRRRG
jgi:LacI family transcriptional regulator